MIYFPGQCGGSSVGRASAFQADCRGFEPRPPLHGLVAQGIEHQPSKLLVASSNLAEVTIVPYTLREGSMGSVNRCFYDISRSFRVISLMAIWRY